MKIDHIRTFLEISNCGNFNRAAENLNVTQSTVSARIKSMEEHFGRILFKRSHSGVELTSAGQHSRTILGHSDTSDRGVSGNLTTRRHYKIPAKRAAQVGDDGLKRVTE